MSRHRRRARPDALHDLDLAPILSVIVLLIPVLLFSFQFFETAAVPVEAPRSGAPGHAPRQDVRVTVVVTRAGFDVAVQDPAAEGEERAQIGRRAGDAEYDFAALHNRLDALKSRYPQTEVVGIGADPDVPWQTLARTIDCARLRLEGAPFEGPDAGRRYESARPARRAGDDGLLFPVVRFVVVDS